MKVNEPVENGPQTDNEIPESLACPEFAGSECGLSHFSVKMDQDAYGHHGVKGVTTYYQVKETPIGARRHGHAITD